jgi:hypothetical protein
MIVYATSKMLMKNGGINNKLMPEIWYSSMIYKVKPANWFTSQWKRHYQFLLAM